MNSKKNNKIPSTRDTAPKKEPVKKFNFSALNKVKSKKKKLLSSKAYQEQILAGDTNFLGQAITLLESQKQEYRDLGLEIMELCLPHSGNSIRLGITGAPGVGKSTLIESFGNHLIKSTNRKIAVLAIDPSSQLSKGSILGDKTRMEQLASNPNAFIRPSPTGDTLGGVAQKTRETIFLCEAAGFDTIFIETVGVGQSEIAVRSMVDIFILLLLPGAGDELQGIKRGIVEMADILLVNKAEAERKKLANEAKRAYRNALHYFPKKGSGWMPKVLTCSALEADNMDAIWSEILAYQTTTTENNYFKNNRQSQAKQWFQDAVQENLSKTFFENEIVQQHYDQFLGEVLEGKVSSSKSAERLLEQFLNSIKEDNYIPPS